MQLRELAKDLGQVVLATVGSLLYLRTELAMTRHPRVCSKAVNLRRCTAGVIHLLKSTIPVPEIVTNLKAKATSKSQRL